MHRRDRRIRQTRDNREGEDMKNFLLALLPNLTTKAAVTAAVCVTAGAAASGAVTTVVYNNKTAEYKETIQELQEEVAEVSGSEGGSKSVANGGSADGSQQATAVRVVDGILEVWDGSQWASYGSVDDVRSEDPFYENEDKRAEVEKSVAEKKLDELGLEINEEGEIVKKEPVPGADPASGDEAQPEAGKKKETIILVGSTAGSGNTNSNNNNTGKASKSSKAAVAAAAPASAAAGLTPEQVMATIQAGGIAPGATTLSTSPTAGVTTVSWTTASSSGGGGGGGGGGNSGGGGGDSGGGGSAQPVSQPASQPASQPTEEHHEEVHNDPPSEPSVSEGGGGGDWGGDVE